MTKTIAVEQLRWTTSLSPELSQELVSVAQRISIEDPALASSSLINRGINFIESGTLAICIQTPNLKTANCLLVGQDGWFGNYIDPNASLLPFIFIEIEPCSIIHFSNQRLRPICEKNAEIYKWFYSLTFESKEKWLQSQLIYSANITERIVYQLIDILAHMNTKESMVEISVSQQQLSDMTGIARQRVNEVMKELERNHLVTLYRGKIRIDSPQRLAAYMDGIDLSIRDPRLYI
ncbi:MULTISPECIES: Crp/Fnr family transcriptional regulator [Vibrio]|uniref:Crp/Fnr family transcriptional regulator n=2 Tax=Vibrio mediterranei TaxID=689 RepID=A0A3G4VJ09_9VIBR|nr:MULTISPECIES: Crp/Fnr family transcriptional regulator [Vibrio]AYV23948.1 Crp/Fnr family transcriptional regulator [Vibrio mediterranei]EDL54747.1 quinol dehydrogenase membrane component [Vibrio mediterranei AK1]MDA0106999.1 Crp/Fnr family transcriptional regulator [Vibrio sp. La 4.2.2]USE02822.1 Crp/Fnr family transcriptional regulator [Vibrio sp. SCSIO 43133]